MKSMRRRVVAMLLTLSMLITMFPASMLANGTSTDGIQTWQISKSKTATELDANYQSKVTLSLPAAQEQLESDVVFVLDKSTSAELEQQALDMLDELNTQIKDTGAKVNVGVVIFNKQANRELELTELNDDNMDTIEAAIKKEISSGTNTHAGLLAGKAMLDADTDVDANRKYLVFVSDGITYMYNETPTVTAWSFYADAWNIWAGPDNWYSKYGTNEAPDNWDSKYGTNEAPDNWDKWMSDIGQQVAEQGTTYEYSYGGTATTSTPQDDNWKTAYAMSIDKALYLTNQLYNEMEAQGYRCYAMKASTNADHPWASSFMDYLADGEQVSFDNIRNDIYYLLDKGSTIDDYMGYVEGEDGYNFDLVINNDDLSNLYMTIERLNADGTTSEPEVLGATKISENKYGFGDERDGRYDYELVYSPANDATEHFTWKTNVPLTNFERVQLHYTVKLMNPKTTPGTYGEYDADGSLGTTKGLFTNNEAKLTAVDSNSQNIVEYFAKPTVSYTVEAKEPVTIRPADITVYTGGDGYTGVVGGVNEEGKEEDGLPTPGYLITLPSDINQEIFGGNQNAQDLTGLVRFVYDGNDDGEYNKEEENGEIVDRIWELALYSSGGNMTSQTSPEDNIARYVYRMDKDTLSETPIRIQFYEGDNTDNFVTSDDFNLSLKDDLYKEFNMTIYPGSLHKGKIKAEILDPKTKQIIATRDVKVESGKLTIRGTTNEEQFSTVGNEEESVVKNVNSHGFAAVAPNEGTKYYINNSQVSVDPANVSLLSDDVVEDSKETLKQYLTENGYTDENENYQYQYLDLVDRTNGNAMVTSSDPIDVYWKLPEGADPDDEFKVVHFSGLDRDFNGQQLEGNINPNEVKIYGDGEDGKLEVVKIGGENYLKFSTKDFSPFVLVWDEKDEPTDPVNPPDGGGTTPNPPDLNTEDHFSYVVGYPEDYRTGEPSDDEDLWPVKPQGNITRAEVASIFYRLLKDDVRDANTTDVSEFSDVRASDWYGTTVATLSAMDIVRGYEDGTFRPNALITRAEFAAIATRFFEETGAEYEPGTFDDVTGDEWFANAIADAVELGLIGGYPDGTVRPNNNITRAEACAIVNRTLGRIPHVDHLLPADDMKTWPDNNPSDWFYADMQEATNGHEYEWTTEQGQKVEEWTEILDKDWEDR